MKLMKYLKDKRQDSFMFVFRFKRSYTGGRLGLLRDTPDD